MLESSEAAAPEPNPFRLLQRRAPIVVSITIVCAVLAAVFSQNRPESYVAAASLVIEDPSGVTLFSTVRAADSERYVANQVAILRSTALAEQASVESKRLDPENPIEPSQFISNTVVSVTPDTEFVEIMFEATDATIAQQGANSVALAYQYTVQQRLEAEVRDAKDNLDEAIDTVLGRIAALQQEIDAIRADSRDRPALDSQVSEIVSELVALRRGNLEAADIEAKAQQLSEELRARQLIAELELQQGPTVPLVRQRTAAIELLNDIYAQQSQIELEAAFAGNGVVTYSPAGPGQPKGISIVASLAIGAALGAMIGVGTAYWLETRAWKFSDRLEPERVLDAPVLAVIPDFGQERLASRLPARDAPASASAESFRFLTVAIDRKQRPGERSRSVAIVSATVGEGKTTVVANTAFAAVQEGLNVLVFDADVGKADLTQLLVYGTQVSAKPGLGLSDVVVAGESFDDVVNVFPTKSGSSLNVLSFGRTHVDPISFFRSADTQRMLATIRARYDLFLIDVPPILHVAYAAPLFGFVDDIVVVVPHGGDSSQLREARERLELLGIHPSGYVYNKAPLGKRPPRVGSLAFTPPDLETLE